MKDLLDKILENFKNYFKRLTKVKNTVSSGKPEIEINSLIVHHFNRQFNKELKHKIETRKNK